MKSKDKNDLRQKSLAELQTVLAEIKKEAEKAKMALGARRVKNTNTVANLRRKTAVVLTLIREKEMLNG